MIVSVTFPMAVRAFGGTPEAGYSVGGWQMIVLAYGVPLAILGLMRFAFVKEDPTIDMAAGDSGVKVGDIITCLKRNRYIWSYSGFYFFSSLATGLAVATFYFTWVVGDLGVMGMLQVLGVAVLPVMFAFPALLRRFSASRLILFGGLIGAVGFTVNFFAQASLPLLAVGMMVAAIGQFPISYLQVLIIRQLADYNEHIGLPRMDASVGMLASMAGQIAVGVGAWWMGLLLETSGYDGTAATQPDSALFMMRVIYGLLPAACYLIMGFFATRFFSLDRLGTRIEAELEAKRAAAAPDGQESPTAQSPTGREQA
jgi:Na+/melibiose symporter-like transporter